MGTVTSRDGTTIAFDRLGDGPVLVLVDGALSHRALGPMAALAEVLAADFTVYRYDRRGRGESGDTAPYAVAREVEDLEAVIAETGGSAHAFGLSSGAVLALEAAASGAAIRRLALYEPPLAVDGGDPAEEKAYIERLDELISAGHRGDAVEWFLSHAGVPGEALAAMRTQPQWPMFEAVAPTLAYDHAILGDGTVPRDRAAKVTATTLVANGGASPTSSSERRRPRRTRSRVQSIGCWRGRPGASPTRRPSPSSSRSSSCGSGRERRQASPSGTLIAHEPSNIAVPAEGTGVPGFSPPRWPGCGARRRARSSCCAGEMVVLRAGQAPSLPLGAPAA